MTLTVLPPLLAAQTQPRSRPNILLITIDTLRADRLGSYGYRDARTPSLDRLAKEGVRFSDATAHAALTFPSHAAILTGRYPGSFGVAKRRRCAAGIGNDRVPQRQEGGGLPHRCSRRRRHPRRRLRPRVQASTRTTTGSWVVHFDSIALANLGRDGRSGHDRVASAGWPRSQRGHTMAYCGCTIPIPHLPYPAPSKFTSHQPNRPYDADVVTDAQLGQLRRRRRSFAHRGRRDHQRSGESSATVVSRSRAVPLRLHAGDR